MAEKLKPCTITLAPKAPSEKTQFYIIEVQFGDNAKKLPQHKKYYVFKTRFSALQKLKDEHEFSQYTVDYFPSVFSSSAESRRSKLETWITELAKYHTEELYKFIQRELLEYGDQDPALNRSIDFIPKNINRNELATNTTYRFEEESRQAEVYVVVHNELRYYDTIKGNTPKLGRVEWFTTIAAYGNRCLFSLSTSGTVIAYYIPWGTTAHLCGIEIKKGSMAYQNGCLWIWEQEDCFLSYIDLYARKHHRCGAASAMRFPVKHSCIAIIGDSVHVITPTFPVLGHYIYNISSKKWTTFRVEEYPMNFKSWEPGISAIASAREFIFVSSKSGLFFQFNIKIPEWIQITAPFSSQVVTMTWNRHKLLYVWTSDMAWTLHLDTGEWTKLESAILNAKFAFSTSEFDDEYAENFAFEDILLEYIVQSKAPWHEMYAKDEISAEFREALLMYESLDVSQRIQYFKKNKDTLADIFKQLASKQEASSRIQCYILQLLRDNPEFENDFTNLIELRFAKKQRGNTIYFYPNKGDGFKGKLPDVPPVNRQRTTSSTTSTTFFTNASRSRLQPSNLTTATATTSTTSTNSTNSTNSNSTASTVTVLTTAEVERRNAICQQLKENNLEVADYFVCPITQQILFDPVVTVDGHTYEKVAIQEWFSKGHKTSPLTNKPLSSCEFIPNLALKKAVEDFMLKNSIKN